MKNREFTETQHYWLSEFFPEKKSAITPVKIHTSHEDGTRDTK